MRLEKLRNWLFGLGVVAFLLSIAGAAAGAGSSEVGYKAVAALTAGWVVLIAGSAWVHGLAARGYGDV
jgi:hypothetical protein